MLKEKRNHILYYTGMVFLLAIFIVLLVVCIVGVTSIKNNADSISQKYNKEAKTYLSQVQSAISLKAKDPASLNDKISGVVMPSLEPILFGEISKDYRDSQILDSNITNLVNDTKNDIKDQGNVYKLVRLLEESNNVISKIDNERGQTGDLIYLNSYLSELNGMQDDINNLLLPTELYAHYASFKTSYNNLISDINQAIKLYQANSDSSNTDYQNQLKKVDSDKETIKNNEKYLTDYYNNWESKQKDIISNFKVRKDNLV